MTVTVGRIVPLECHEPPPFPTCARCAELEAAIAEYLDGYISRRVAQEGAALKKLGAAIGRGGA